MRQVYPVGLTACFNEATGADPVDAPKAAGLYAWVLSLQ